MTQFLSMREEKPPAGSREGFLGVPLPRAIPVALLEEAGLLHNARARPHTGFRWTEPLGKAGRLLFRPKAWEGCPPLELGGLAVHRERVFLSWALPGTASPRFTCYHQPKTALETLNCVGTVNRLSGQSALLYLTKARFWSLLKLV